MFLNCKVVDWSIIFNWTISFKNAPMCGVGRPNKICKTHITTKSKSNFAVMELVGLGLFFSLTFISLSNNNEITPKIMLINLYCTQAKET